MRTTTVLGMAMAVLLTVMAGVLPSESSAGPPGGAALTAHGSDGDWPMWQKDVWGSRFNAGETTITPRTVGQLELKWAYAYDHLPYTRMGSQPAVVHGVLYVGAPNGRFLALDAKTGKTRWSFDLSTVADPPPDMPNSVRDGAAVVGDKVYFGDSTGRVYALYRKTGKLAWATRLEDHPGVRMTGSPLVFDGRVYIGVSSWEDTSKDAPCCTNRGQVAALDAATGEIEWRYYTVPPAERVGTWPSGAPKYAPSGGSVWSSPVVDPRTRTMYVGTGNNYTGQAGDINSVLAFDVDTGEIRWKQRLTFPDTFTPHCDAPDPGAYCPGKGEYAHNFDVGATPNIIRLRDRTLVAVGQKGGMFHAFDAGTGEIVWQTRLAWPEGDVGADAYSVEWGSFYDGELIYAATWRANPGKLFALDPATGEIVWDRKHPEDGCTQGGAARYPNLCELAFTPAVSGSPGLIYEGSADGKMRVFSTEDGSLLWEFDAIRDFQGVNGKPGRGSAISGNGGAVVADGMLYVQAGYFPFYPSDKGSVLLAFGL